MKKKIIGNPEEKNRYLIDLINKIKFNDLFLDRQYDFRDIVLKNIIKTDDILDVGKSMREKYEKIQSKSIETLDVNDFGDYPDIICDICSDISGLESKYDKIICIAVLEHVYDPTSAIANLNKMLKNGGILYGYVPYLFQYLSLIHI